MGRKHTLPPHIFDGSGALARQPHSACYADGLSSDSLYTSRISVSLRFSATLT